MTTDTADINILDKLNLTLVQVSELKGRERTRLLHFLRRWEYLDALHTCLDTYEPLTLVSLLDLRARAYLAQGELAQALDTLQQRLEKKTSIPASGLLARIHIAREDLETAFHIANQLTQENTESVMAWSLLGEIELARGNIEAAIQAYRRLHELRPQSRAYLLGMMWVYQAREDWVTASGYAVRLMRTAEEGGQPLSAGYLRHLRTYFQASNEETRFAAIKRELRDRHGEEMAEMLALFSDTVPSPKPAPRIKPPPPPEPVEPLQTFENIPISDDERTRIHEAVKHWFGFETLLPGQVETLACVLRGEDVLTILPTGGGKSLCYQLAAVLSERGTTLVISPLIALMKDQVDSLPETLRRHATTLNSSLTGDELNRRLERAAAGHYRLIYVAPERLRQPPFIHAMKQADIQRLVVDEAHCVSVWGHDFRPDYLMLGEARKALGNPQLLAMTATAPPRVRQDIIQHLTPSSELSNGTTTEVVTTNPGEIRIVAGDVTRPNLQLEVFQARDLDEKLTRLLTFCQEETGSGIVYAGTRARCEELAALLRRYGVNADHYHAGITNRDSVQDAFMRDQIRVVVATVAFGLGIDKPDIRFIVHYMPPPSLEAYYQEAGRAGRDGLPARCLLMYSSSDRGMLTRRARRDMLKVEFLRSVYGAIKARLDHGASDSTNIRHATIPMADLTRDLRTEEVRVRVAISLLEEAGLLQRGPDLPRAVQVRISDIGQKCHPERSRRTQAQRRHPEHSRRTQAQRRHPEHSRRISQPDNALPATADDDLLAFCEAARLYPEQWLTLDLVDVARRAGLPLDDIEQRLLTWQDEGWLSYRPAGRDLTLKLLPPPKDAHDRVAALLERYETIQAQHVDEITVYAQTDRCRHGHLNAYLGGRPIQRCAACDNCIQIPPPSDIGLPDKHEQRLIILRCVAGAPWSWGRQSLQRILRGSPKAPASAQRSHPGFGALAFRSSTAIGHMLKHLERKDLLSPRELDHGGEVLDLTPAGRAILASPTPHDELAKLVTKPKITPTKKEGPNIPVDEALFEKLRAWRREQAIDQGMPPYVIFHDQHLRTIAAHRPVTLDTFADLKGVGKRRLERYGEAVVALVKAHLKEIPP